MRGRLPALLVAVAAVAVLAGCGDGTGIRADFNNEEDTLSVFALNGTLPTLPSAVHVRSVQAVRIDGTFGFDFALDFNAAGEVVLHAVRRVASQTVNTRQVGFQLTEHSFESALTAPTSGYAYDTSLVIPVGKVFFIDVIEPECGFSFLGPNIRAKAVIDSVNPARRVMFVHLLANRNCGFRSLVRGEPKE